METQETKNDNAPAVPEEKPIRHYDKEVRHELSVQECADYGKKLGSLHEEKRLLEDKKKSVMKEMASDIEKLEIEIGRVSDALSKGKELRLTRVYDIWANGQISIRREHDNVEVDVRPPTHADRQVTVPGAAPGSGPKRGEDYIPGVDDPKPNGSNGKHDLDDDIEEIDEAGGIVKSATGGEVFHQPDDDEDDGDTSNVIVMTPPGGAPVLDEEDETVADKPKAKKKAAAKRPDAKAKKK